MSLMEQPAWLYIIIWQQAWLYIICIIYYMSGAGLALYCSATDEKNKQLFASSIKRRHWYTSDQFTYCIPKSHVCKSICIFKHCKFFRFFSDGWKKRKLPAGDKRFRVLAANWGNLMLLLLHLLHMHKSLFP